MTALEELASVLTIAPELAVQRPLIETLVPGSNSQLLADPAGALWLGAAFTRGAVPRMRLYLNTSWGNTVERFARMRTVAAAFGSAEMWRRAEGVLPRALEPLGVALTLGPGNPPCAALYFRSFGLRLDDYVALAREAAGEANAAGIAAFGLALLGNEARYPASTAVLSFGFRAGSDITADLEFCAHCLFRDDVEAQNRMLAVLAEAGIDPAPYLRMLARLQQGAGRSGQPRIHSFVGITGKSSSPAISVYLKPVMVPYG